MKKFLSSFFLILQFFGFGLFVVGIGHTRFYVFLNDNPVGWIIIFGSIIIGALGRGIIEKIEQKDSDKNYGSSNSCLTYTNAGVDVDCGTHSSYYSKSSFNSEYSFDYGSKNDEYDKWLEDDSIGDRYDSDGKIVGCVISDGDYLNAEVDSDGRVTYRDRDGDRLYF